MIWRGLVNGGGCSMKHLIITYCPRSSSDDKTPALNVASQNVWRLLKLHLNQHTTDSHDKVQVRKERLSAKTGGHRPFNDEERFNNGQ